MEGHSPARNVIKLRLKQFKWTLFKDPTFSGEFHPDKASPSGMGATA
jgi:hypothetical protein